MTSSNPLLDFSDLPRFDEIRAEHITPALDALLADVAAAIERACAPDTPATWEEVVHPAARARMGRGRPFKRSCGYARIARRARRKFAAHHALLVQCRTKPGALSKVQGDC